MPGPRQAGEPPVHPLKPYQRGNPQALRPWRQCDAQPDPPTTPICCDAPSRDEAGPARNFRRVDTPTRK
ncbi:hypothetical protein NXT3_PC00768 (plasmid) [Sinorhizobium fredii]|uniref:Uncharacterized protein n=1 Tax=Rhizobium fredii TaxID=380 RepID=A0A2L0HGQ7_RHIFR|nr:hypothetical protein NXT3_PC00768 [Sinorhizobium fredii]